MKLFYSGFLALSAALLMGGCSTLQQTNAQIDEGVHAPKRSIDMAKGTVTDEYIKQINMSLGMAKGDNDGKPPATLEDAKKAAKECPPEMWIDGETGLPLEYDPITGTVHRKGAAADSAPHAGAPGAPGRINIPGSGGNG